MRLGTELDEVEMPTVDSNRSAIFLDDAPNRARSQSKRDRVAFAEPTFRHGLFSVLLHQGGPPSNACR